MLKANRIRLYPTIVQVSALATQFGCARWVWNNALALSAELYKATGKGLNYHAMAVRLPKLKQEFDWLRDADSQVLQQSVQNLARGFDNFFAKRARYPRFKVKGGRQSIHYSQRVKIVGARIYLPKVGWVRCVVHREICGKTKTVTVTRSACGHFHAAVLVEDGELLPIASTDGPAIGVDLGLTHIAVTSDGAKFENPRHLRKAEKNLRRKQRKLSRKKKGSNNRNKARQLVARVYDRVACARRDHLHKLSRRIVNENQVIAVESLNVKGLIKNHRVAKATGDAGWYMFAGFLEYKSAWSGKTFVRCDRWYPSSKTCSACGWVRTPMPIDVRTWDCARCGTHLDRDINAAVNIRDEGLRILAAGVAASAGGGSVSPGKRRNPRAGQLLKKPEIRSFGTA